mmetsp:Transcript_49019/g.87381  ORF Transcript_49019/g.87381 Transcript_49019/m.87381 type:complete len:88 (+) Transcript_49019:764-1027(+)
MSAALSLLLLFLPVVSAVTHPTMLVAMMTITPPSNHTRTSDKEQGSSKHVTNLKSQMWPMQDAVVDQLSSTYSTIKQYQPGATKVRL